MVRNSVQPVRVKLKAANRQSCSCSSLKTPSRAQLFLDAPGTPQNSAKSGLSEYLDRVGNLTSWTKQYLRHQIQLHDVDAVIQAENETEIRGR